MPNIATRVQQHRDRLRRAGLRPIQIWVPDTRAAGFSAECKRQSLIVASSDEGDIELTELLENSLNDIKGWE
ncbi:antitoxin MazE family protein [Rheinheimera gaetbuli]